MHPSPLIAKPDFSRAGGGPARECNHRLPLAGRGRGPDPSLYDGRARRNGQFCEVHHRLPAPCLPAGGREDGRHHGRSLQSSASSQPPNPAPHTHRQTYTTTTTTFPALQPGRNTPAPVAYPCAHVVRCPPAGPGCSPGHSSLPRSVATVHNVKRPTHDPAPTPAPGRGARLSASPACSTSPAPKPSRTTCCTPSSSRSTRRSVSTTGRSTLCTRPATASASDSPQLCASTGHMSGGHYVVWSLVSLCG